MPARVESFCIAKPPVTWLRRRPRGLLLTLLLCCAASAPLPREPLDLSDPAQLTQALELRAGGPGGRHIILFGVYVKPSKVMPASEDDLSTMWFLMAQNLILHLATTQGGAYDHVRALVMDIAAACLLLLTCVRYPFCICSTSR